MDQVFEGTPKAEIRLEGRKLMRSAVSNDWATRLQWKISKDGKVITIVPARAEMSCELPAGEPGTYEVVLEIWKYEGYRVKDKGKFIEISNKVNYTI